MSPLLEPMLRRRGLLLLLLLDAAWVPHPAGAPRLLRRGWVSAAALGLGGALALAAKERDAPVLLTFFGAHSGAMPGGRCRVGFPGLDMAFYGYFMRFLRRNGLEITIRRGFLML